MRKKNIKCIICISHLIGLLVGVAASLLYYKLVRPESKKEEIKKAVIKAFKTIKNKIDL